MLQNHFRKQNIYFILENLNTYLNLNILFIFKKWLIIYKKRQENINIIAY